MHKYDLKPLTPLGAIEPREDQIGRLTIRQIIDFELVSIAKRDGPKTAFLNFAKKAFGGKLPQAGHSATSKRGTVIWLGPDQWLFETRGDTDHDLAYTVKETFGQSASVTEQTGGWCRFDLEGEHTVSLLQRLCALDFETMESGDATRSVIEHIGALIVCDNAKTKFRIYGPSSYAGSLHHALVTAANSIA